MPDPLADTRVAQPWHWDGPGGLDDDARHAKLRQLGEWVAWLVARYDLASQVPPCWPLHPALLDELKALWYWHQEVTYPEGVLTRPDPPSSPGTTQQIQDPGVRAAEYWAWHEARWRWATTMVGSTYHRCVDKGKHVEETQDVDGFDEQTAAALEALLVREGSAPTGPKDPAPS